MSKLLLGGLLSGLSAVTLLSATTPIYINNSPLLAPPALPPQIDATAFVNRSVFDVNTAGLGFIFVVGDQIFALGASVPPYRMMNTLFVTNAPGAIIRGSPGYQFDSFSSSNNTRLGLAVWENRGVVAGDPLVRVIATNIFSRGALEVSDLGLIKLEGTNVDLSRSTLLAGIGANTPPPFGGAISGTNHFNAPGVSDIYWGAGLNNRVTNGAPGMRLDVNGFTNTAAISSPAHQVVRLLGSGLFTNLVTLFAGGATPFVYTNQVGADEFQVQVAFVNTNSFDPNFRTEVRFVPIPGSPNGGADVIVALESADFDIISGNVVTNGIYFIDHSAFTTNISVTWNGPNFLGERRTRRPNTYELFRIKPFEWDSPSATNGNGVFTNTTLYNTNMTANFVTNGYAAYSASFSSPALTNINIFGVPVIPPPGRVEISAQDLKLDRTRIKAETTLTIKAENLSSNAFAIVDAPLIEYDIASTAPPLVISNLVPASVRRFSGQIQAWSGVWDTTELDPNDTNRVITTHFHMLIFNSFVQTEIGVTIRDFFLKADDITIADIITVGRAMEIDTRNLTVTDTAVLSLPGSYNIAPSNVINLVNFTNFGVINAGGNAALGVGEGVDPLENYVIAPGGSFSAAGHEIGAVSFQLGGLLFASAGGITIEADSVNLSGNIGATSDIEIRAPVIVASNSFITAGSLTAPASLIFDASDTFVDAGIGEPNDWTAHGGIQVLTLPATGDLLGTTVRVPRPNFGEALILWPASDFGDNAGGFVNNLALGTLVLDGGTFSLFRFESVQDPGAIYINRLELIGEPAADPVNAIEIEPGMTVYFADSNVDPTTLDGLHGGRLQWVEGFVSPLNATNVVYPSGEVYTLNAALVRSMVLDSDGDGIVNGLDSTPVIVGDRIDLQIATSRGDPKKTVISWIAPANSTSVVEYKNSLTDSTWQSFPAMENGATAQRFSISDAPPGSSSTQRFYRVRTQQR